MSRSSRVDSEEPAIGTGGGEHPAVLGVELSAPFFLGHAGQLKFKKIDTIFKIYLKFSVQACL